MTESKQLKETQQLDLELYILNNFGGTAQQIEECERRIYETSKCRSRCKDLKRKKERIPNRDSVSDA